MKSANSYIFLLQKFLVKQENWVISANIWGKWKWFYPQKLQILLVSIADKTDIITSIKQKILELINYTRSDPEPKFSG